MGWVRSRIDGCVTMKPVAFIYTCCNPGQVALMWNHQPPPFGHGWIDVKRVGLVREDEVEALLRAAYARGRQDEDGQGYNESEVDTVIRELLK